MTTTEIVDPKRQVPMLVTPGAGTRVRRVRAVLSPEVAAILRAARLRQGRTAAQVAAEVGVSDRTVRGLERPDRAPSKVVARRLWVALELSMDEAQSLLDEAIGDAGLSRTDRLAS
jgi:ribosome-binding protein aMBF1 (putative translation factor)